MGSCSLKALRGAQPASCITVAATQWTYHRAFWKEDLGEGPSVGEPGPSWWFPTSAVTPHPFCLCWLLFPRPAHRDIIKRGLFIPGLWFQSNCSPADKSEPASPLSTAAFLCFFLCLVNAFFCFQSLSTYLTSCALFLIYLPFQGNTCTQIKT